MLRRVLVTTIRRSFLVLLLICLGCVAQSAPPDVARKIERHVRAYYTIPAAVKVTVGPIVPTTEMPGYDAVSVQVGGGEDKPKDYKFLISKDRSSMIRMIKFDMTKDPYVELMSKIDVKGRPSRGAKDAKVVVVNYDDFECPFCSRMHATLMQEILPQYADRIKIVYKDYPLPMHPWAKHAANDANCLAKENGDGFWEFADYVHANQKQISGDQDIAKSSAMLDKLALDFGAKHGADSTGLQACIKQQPDAQLKSSMGEADGMGVNATPTMFINGERLEGAVDPDQIRLVLNQQLQAAGIQPPPPLPSDSNGGSAEKPVSK